MLGADFVDFVNAKAGFLRRDFGLFEVVFFEPARWRCAKVAVQAHRLFGGADVVPPRLAEAVGQFPHAVPFEALNDSIGKLGGRTSLDPRSDAEYLIFKVGDMRSAIHVVNSDADPESGFPGKGMVWSIQAEG